MGAIGKLQLVYGLGFILSIRHIKSVGFVGLGNIAFDKWLFAQTETLCLSKLKVICNLYYFLCVVKLIKRRRKCKNIKMFMFSYFQSK